MYNDFYSLSAEPFRLSPDPLFCYRHPSYSKARAYMQYALERGEGFVLVTGIPGTGKTTLIEDLLAGLASAPVIVSHLTTTQLQGDDLLRMVCYEIGADAQGLDKATLLRRIQEMLLHQASKGRRTLLVVDEAQDLSESALEELRLLTNLQASRRPLLQIFLVGQDALRRMVAKPSMEQLKQRILAACHLEPLKLKETREYLRHRLKCAGWCGDPIISGDVVRLVHAASLGVPRRINIVADRLLLHGYVEGKHELGEADARVVVHELRQEQLFSAGGEEAAGQASVSDVDTLSPLALLGESAEPDRQAQAKPPQARTVAGVQAERGGSGPGAGNVARLAVREVPNVAAPPAAAPDRSGGPGEAAAARAEMSIAGMPAMLIPSPLDGPEPQRPQGVARDTALKGDAAGARPAPPPVAAPSKGNTWRYSLVGVLFLLAVAFAMVLGRPDLMPLVESQWDTWKARLSDLQTSLTSPQDNRRGSFPSTGGPKPVGVPPTEPPRQTQPDPADRQSRFPTDVESGVMDTPAAGQEDGETYASVSGFELSQGPEGPAVVATAGVRAISASGSPGLPQPAADPSPAAGSNAEVNGGELRDMAGDDVGHTQPSLVVPALSGLSGSVAAPSEIPSRGDGASSTAAQPSGPQQSSSTTTLVEPSAVQLDTPRRVDRSGTRLAQESSLEQPPVLDSMHADLRRSGLPVQRLDDGTLKLSLRREIPFRFDSAEVPERSREVLDMLARLLGRHRQWTLTVIGHTDNTGPDDYNLALSLERARSVADYLVEKGLPAGQVSSDGKGESEPVFAGQVASGYRKWLDRRIEMVIRSTEPLPGRDTALSPGLPPPS